MNQKTKWVSLGFVIAIFMIFMVAGVVTSFGKNEFVEKKNGLEQYDTPYTKCEKNEDGTYSFYIYAAPMRYEKDGMYYNKDLSIVKSDQKEYTYMNQFSDIKTYFPQKLTEAFSIWKDGESTEFYFSGDMKGFGKGEKIEFENIYGDNVEAVEYKNEEGMQIICYATISGIQIEYICKGNSKLPTLFVSTDANLVEQKDNGYILLERYKIKELVINEPVIQRADKEELTFDFKMQYKRKKDGCQLTIKQSKDYECEDLRLSFSIEKYMDKMPDSSVYSDFDHNSYLRNYAVIGNHETLGMGIHYLRFRLNYYMVADPKTIISAHYYMKNLDGNGRKTNIDLYQNAEQWSSTRMVWTDRVKSEEKPFSTGSYLDNGWIDFDITQFAKACLGDVTWSMESLGVSMMCSDGSAVVATSDNSLYVPYLKLVMRELPYAFSGEVDINPPQ